MAKISNEFKTGVVVIVSVVVLAALLVTVGKIHPFEKRHMYKVVFSYTNGLDKNAPVRLAGVEVGQVSDVKLDYEGATKVVVTLDLEPDAKIRKDAKVYAATLGLMGEKYVEITPGSEGAEFLEAGSTLAGEDPIRMEELMDMAKDIAAKIDDSMADVQSFVKNLNSIVTDHRGEIDSIIANLDQTSKNFNEFSDDIRRHPWKLLMKGKEEKKK